ncbi:hypothetical protein ACFC1I_05925 [Microbacterium sp. NPDC056044]
MKTEVLTAGSVRAESARRRVDEPSVFVSAGCDIDIGVGLSPGDCR